MSRQDFHSSSHAVVTLRLHLKTASSRRIRAKYSDHLRRFYWKPFFWHPAYYVGSVGHASLETVKRYAPFQGLNGSGTKTSTKR